MPQNTGRVKFKYKELFFFFFIENINKIVFLWIFIILTKYVEMIDYTGINLLNVWSTGPNFARKTIHPSGTTEDWSYFTLRWTEYVVATQISEKDLVSWMLRWNFAQRSNSICRLSTHWKGRDRCSKSHPIISNQRGEHVSTCYATQYGT